MKKIISNILCILVIISAVVVTDYPDVKADEPNGFTVTSIYLPTSQEAYYPETEEEQVGDATLIKSSNEYILMDGGYSYHKTNVFLYLYTKAVYNLSLYVSHMHVDHFQGIMELLKRPGAKALFNIQKLYLPRYGLSDYHYEEKITTYYNQLVNLATSQGIEVVQLSVGDNFTVGYANFEIIGPVNTYEWDWYDTNLSTMALTTKRNRWGNDDSLVCRVTSGNKSFLTAGDISQNEEKLLINRYGSYLKSDLLKMSHHGALDSNSVAFLDKVKPDYMFCSVSSKNLKYYSASKTYYNSAKVSVRKRMQKKGVYFLVNDEKAMITFALTNDKISVYKAAESTGYTNKKFSTDIKVVGGVTKWRPYDRFKVTTAGGVIRGIYSGTVNGVNGVFDLQEGGALRSGNYSSKGEYEPWVTVSSKKKYVYKTKNNLAVNIKKVDGKYYYFNRATGLYEKGIKTYSNKLYYFGAKYYAKKGFVNTGGKKYYCENTQGLLSKGWKTIEGKKYYFDDLDNNSALTGFQDIYEHSYYFRSDGSLIKTTENKMLVKVGSKSYIINKDGTLCKPGYINYTYKLCIPKTTKIQAFKDKKLTKKTIKLSKTYYRIVSTTSKYVKIKTSTNKIYYLPKAKVNISATKAKRYVGENYKMVKGEYFIEDVPHYFDTTTGYLIT